MFRSRTHLFNLASHVIKRRTAPLSTLTPDISSPFDHDNSLYIPEHFPVIGEKIIESAAEFNYRASMPPIPIQHDSNRYLKNIGSNHHPIYTGYGPFNNHQELTHRCEIMGIPVIGPAYKDIKAFEDSVFGERFMHHLGMRTYYNAQHANNDDIMQVLDIQLINGQFIGLRNNTILHLPRGETNPILLHDALVLSLKLGPALLEAGYTGTLTARFHVHQRAGWVFQAFKTQLTTDHLITEKTSGENLIWLSMKSFIEKDIPLPRDVLKPKRAVRLIPILPCLVQPHFETGRLNFLPYPKTDAQINLSKIDHKRQPGTTASFISQQGEVVVMKGHNFGFSEWFNGYGHNRHAERAIGYILGMGDTQLEADKHAEQLASECEFVSGSHRLPLNLDYAVTALRYLRKHHHDEHVKPATKKVNAAIAEACVDDLIHRPMAAMVKSHAGKK